MHFGHKNFVLFLLLSLFSGAVSAVPFEVTHTRDDGSAGSLRWALNEAAANGSATRDEITFNIAGADPSIVLLSALPELSSNLLIDGTTQPGARFGVSDARIRLVIPPNRAVLTGLRGVKLTNVAVYGLFIDKPVFTANDSQLQNQAGPAGIQIHNSKNIDIGAVGKGNMVRNMYRDIDVGFEFMGLSTDLTDETLLMENVRIVNNIVGLDLTGDTKAALQFSLIYANRVRNLTVSDNSVGGKIFYSDVANAATYKLGKLTFAGNRVGLNFAGTAALGTFPFSSIDECMSISSDLAEECEVTGNILTGGRDGLTLSVKCFFKIRSNKFGTDRAGNVIGLAHSAIILSNSSGGGIVGGATDVEGNVFKGCFSHQYPGYEAVGVIQNAHTAKVELNRNIFECNYNHYSYQANTALTGVEVAISNRGSTLIEGTATPNAQVSLYYSKSCKFCEPGEYFRTVTANAAGIWSFSGTLQEHNIIASATLHGATSEFSSIKADYAPSDLKITMVCGTQKGSISGISYKNARGYTWYTGNGQILSTQKNISGLNAGFYYLQITDGYCNAQTELFEIKDVTVSMSAGMTITPATCNTPDKTSNRDGSITGITASGTRFEWRDTKDVLVNTNTAVSDLLSAPGGLYTLTIFSEAYCSRKFGPFAIPVQGNPAIDASNVTIVPATCGRNNGSIKGLRLPSGTFTTSVWYDENKNPIQQFIDLSDVGPGRYTLQLSGGSLCGSVASAVIEIPEKDAITIDESGAVSSLAACNGQGGSVRGIAVSGATSVEWLNVAGTVVSQTAVLENVTPGTYVLVARNPGCSKQSKEYVIGRANGTIYPDYKVVALDPSCNTASGSLEVLTGTGLQPRSIRWVGPSGTTVGSGKVVNGLAAGIYSLMLTDEFGCEDLYRSVTLKAVAPLQFNAFAAAVTDDACNFGTGSVKNLVVTGGVPPYTYFWTDATGKELAKTADLAGLKAGVYIFHAVDALGGPCNAITRNYTIADRQNGLTPPVLKDVELCAPGDARIVVTEPKPGIYRLFESLTASIPMRENTTGLFTVRVSGDTPFYIEYAAGSCTSIRTPVTVRINDKGFKIAGSFTPNSDGINDTWTIDNIQSYPNAEVRVFNREGAVVFESVGYAQPFDGRRRGSELPAGTYYYLIDLRSNCRPLSGSLTMIR